jgi:hypothetical protein
LSNSRPDDRTEAPLSLNRRSVFRLYVQEKLKIIRQIAESGVTILLVAKYTPDFGDRQRLGHAASGVGGKARDRRLWPMTSCPERLKLYIGGAIVGGSPCVGTTDVTVCFDSKARNEVRSLLSRSYLSHELTRGDAMKLVRFDNGKTGLLVQLPTGLRVIDVAGSLGALSPEDPTTGVLNSVLNRDSWGPLIEHWRQASVGLRRLVLLAAFGPGNCRLVIRRLDEIHFGFTAVKSTEVAALEIADLHDVARDPSAREAMPRQVALPPRGDECVDGRVVSLEAYRRLKSGAFSNARC